MWSERETRIKDDRTSGKKLLSTEMEKDEGCGEDQKFSFSLVKF